MVLAPADRAAVLALWRKLGTNVGIYTTEALERCAQDLRGLPFLQDLFPPPKLEPRLRPGHSPRPEGGRRAELGREPPGRPAGHPVVPARAAHAQAARGPGLFQAAVPLPAGDPRPALPRRLQPQHARLAGQVSEPRDLGVGPQQWLNWEGGSGGLQCLSKVRSPGCARVLF